MSRIYDEIDRIEMKFLESVNDTHSTLKISDPPFEPRIPN